MWQCDNEQAEGRHDRGDRHEERPLLHTTHEGQEDDEEDLANLVAGIDPVI